MSDDYTPPAPIKITDIATIVPAPPRDDEPVDTTYQATVSRWKALKEEHDQLGTTKHVHAYKSLRKAKVPLHDKDGNRIGYDILLRHVCECGEHKTETILERVVY